MPATLQEQLAAGEASHMAAQQTLTAELESQQVEHSAKVSQLEEHSKALSDKLAVQTITSQQTIQDLKAKHEATTAALEQSKAQAEALADALQSIRQVSTWLGLRSPQPAAPALGAASVSACPCRPLSPWSKPTRRS